MNMFSKHSVTCRTILCRRLMVNISSLGKGDIIIHIPFMITRWWLMCFLALLFCPMVFIDLCSYVCLA